jgi:protein-S-isoprenylcysteine O-methyltransferase Ste14
VLRAWQPSVAAGVAVLVTTFGGATVLERLTGRFGFHPAAAVAGIVLVAAGVALHAWARRTLGAMWSGVVQVRAQHVLVERGYRSSATRSTSRAPPRRRTFLAHPSPASACSRAGSRSASC